MAFVHEAGAGLNKLTSLALHLEDTSGSVVTAAVLDKALMTLVGACPTLTSFIFQGHPLPHFLHVLGDSCPMLTSLTFVGPASKDEAYLQRMLTLQLSLLPRINSLALKDCDEEYNHLPDMTGNPSITSLHLHLFVFQQKEQWLCLPPYLQHLRCSHMREGPPASRDGNHLLVNLLTLELGEQPSSLPLNAFAQLLRAAPAFQGLDCPCIIESDLFDTRGDAIAGDLDFLNQRMEVSTVKNATCHLHHELRYQVGR